MKNYFSYKSLLGLALGALSGFGYWYFVGCESGSCGITSIWYHSTLYGAIMGFLAVQSFTRPDNSED